MFKVDADNAAAFLDESALEKAEQKARQSLQMVREGSGPGSEWLGWRRILSDPNDAELERIDTLAKQLRQEIDVFVVCGIGGSYLGAKALTEALTPAFKSLNDVEIVYAGHHMSGQYLQELIEYLQQPKPDESPKQVAVNVISKSGTTLETALAFRILRSFMHEQFPDRAADRIICTTSASGGALNALADAHGYDRFVIPDDVGGRFSVLTPVGLLPAAVAGIDIRTLFYGAVSKYEELEKEADSLLRYAACRYLFENQSKSVDLITSFEPQLHGFCRWLQQLLGESEGKQGRGLFPVAAKYSTDLHSIGQFVQQGAPSMIETSIEVTNQSESPQVLKFEEDDDQLNYLAGKSLHEINQKALAATRSAHIDGNVPCFTVSMDEMNAQHIGEFIYYFELFTAVYCYMLGVNPFNQPGVEDYKREMYNLLGKNK